MKRTVILDIAKKTVVVRMVAKNQKEAIALYEQFVNPQRKR